MLLGLGLCIGVGLAEGALRLAAALDEGLARELYDPTAVKIVRMGEVGFAPRPGARFEYRNGAVSTINALGWRGPVVAMPKPPGTLRILLLGGSTSHGWGVQDDETIDAYLRRELARRYPGQRAEVVNLAFDGYDSYQDSERLRLHGRPLDPDVVILNSGINDVRNAKIPNLVDRDPRSLQWLPVLERLRDEEQRGGPRLRTRIKQHLYLARIPSFVRDRLVRMRNEQQLRARAALAAAAADADASGAPRGAAPADSAPPAMREAADYFERNLLRAAAAVQDRDVTLLFSTPPSALRYMPPDARSNIQYWLANGQLTQAFRDSLDVRMRRVAAGLAEGGQRALYVPHDFPRELFLDDCHLTREGNAQMARDFADALAPALAARGWTAAPAAPVPDEGGRS